jgi:hypothetical protein
MEWKECCSRMISSSPFNLRMMRVREAHAKANPNAIRKTLTIHHRKVANILTARIRDIEMIAILNRRSRCPQTKKGGQAAKQHHVPLSGGNSLPALMEFRKEDGARLNVPSDSVVILDMSDRLETSRDIIVCSRPEWGLYSRTNGRW